MMKMVTLASFCLALVLCAGSVQAQTESFDVITALTPPTANGNVTASGWVGALRSVPLGSTGIFQGNDGVFPSQAGPPNGYMGMNFNNTSGANTISTWAMSPVLNMQNGDSFTFYTRTVTGNPFPDRLEVRLSTAGASTDVGNNATSVGDFGTLLLSVDPNLSGAYPDVWTQFGATLSGLGGPTSGRLAFRYFVTDGGPAGANSNYIGIDSFEYSAVPEPVTGVTVLIGLAGLAIRRRLAA